jgi:hypothetical protein
MTDIVHKYSGSSSDLLLINSRMGADVSKDTLKRYINNKCIQLNVALNKLPGLLCHENQICPFLHLPLHNFDFCQDYQKMP